MTAATAPPRTDAPAVDAVLQAVDDSPLPVAVVELPSTTILAASRSALEVLGHDRTVLGSTVEDITSDGPTGGFDLVRSGRLTGYATTRVFTGRDGERPVHVWVRALPGPLPVEHVLTVLSRTDELKAGLRALDPDGTGPAAVIGTVDRVLAVDRVSADVERLLDRPAADVLHRPLLQFVEPGESAGLLLAMAEATATGRGVGARSVVRRRDGGTVPVAVSIVPLQPAPSFAFALAPEPRRLGGDEPARLLQSVAGAVDCTEASLAIGERCRAVPGLSRLSTRELHVVGRLVEGDRVPAIARSLYLSQSTVRNHLSSVYRKLGVSSQQELITLLRRRSDGPST